MPSSRSSAKVSSAPLKSWFEFSNSNNRCGVWSSFIQSVLFIQSPAAANWTTRRFAICKVKSATQVPSPKSTTARVVPVGAKWYVPKGPRFRRRMMVGASGSSALSEFDMPSSRAVSQRAAMDADPQIETREQYMRINTMKFAAPELLGVVSQKVRIVELRSPRTGRLKSIAVENFRQKRTQRSEIPLARPHRLATGSIRQL